LIDFTLFTPLQSKMISSHIWNKIYHLTLTALPHYCVKHEQVQFCKKKTCTFLLISRSEKDVTVIWFCFC